MKGGVIFLTVILVRTRGKRSGRVLLEVELWCGKEVTEEIKTLEISVRLILSVGFY